MKFSIIFVIIYVFVNVESRVSFPGLNHIKPRSSPEVQAATVKDLIQRLVPERADEFQVQVVPNSDPEAQDTFQIKKLPDGTVQIIGTTGVAAATGFHNYLKYSCNCHVSWEISQLEIPEELPQINSTTSLNDKFRYYQNVCTTSYSFVWWNWQQWEKHIDWMALNAFNLVLAFNGQEAIWERVYQKFNLTQTEIDDHFSGPAFLSWLRMGNIKGWGGPLSSSWHSRSLVLQKQILERMRNFGMIPVLPAFAGHVPEPFKQLFPDANMVKMATWNGFEDKYCCPYFLDPTEELFNQIGKLFIEEQINEFGTDHVYNCDSFNENTPTTTDLVYLANVGKSIYKAMTDADPEAIWMMQGWMFSYDEYWQDLDRVEALVTSIPLGKMIVLDLQSEQNPQYDKLDQYFGQPYIWCMLHNFGGTLGMFGSSSIINEEPILARLTQNSTMVGTGLTPEGINQNYVIYDLMTETSWRSEPTNLTQWFQDYSNRRYGTDDPDAISAWIKLQGSIYDFQEPTKMRGQYAITRTPSMKIDTWSWYQSEVLLEAWDSLWDAAANLGNSSGYLHDLVDVTRQVLQVEGDIYYDLMVEAFQEKNIVAFQNNATKFLEIFKDLEEILASSDEFLVGKWIQSAKECADNPVDKELFEYNARNQITLWGPNGEIMNYANKQWSGVVSNFFGPRWSIFVAYANETLLNGTPFDQTFIKGRMFDEVEEPFTFDRTEFPVKPTGDSVEIAGRIHEKWRGSHRRIPRMSQEDNQQIYAKNPKIVLL